MKKNKRSNVRVAELKPVRSFGIKFRNHGHRNWFVLSVLFITFCVLMSISKYERFWLVWGRGFFSINVVLAIIATRFGQKTTELHSQDCIWWNGLLAVVLIIIDVSIFGIRGFYH